MPRRKLDDPMQEILEGQRASAPARQTASATARQTAGETFKVTYLLPEELVEELRRRYHEQRAQGEDVTMSGMVAEALGAYLGQADIRDA